MKKVIMLVHMNQRKGSTLYARIYDAETNELLVSATLDYCVRAIQERGWFVIEQK